VSGQIGSSDTDNPFSTRRVRPGAVPFLFAGGQSAGRLIEQFKEDGWQGQIVGPHGTGKSALLATLVPLIEQAGRRTLTIELHDGQRRLPPGLLPSDSPAEPTVLIVDGYEQLGRLSRFRLKRFWRRDGLGLLVTSHRSVGLPDLYRSKADLELLQRIVEQLQRDCLVQMTADEVADRFAENGGNVREALFALYDLYETRRRCS
jgi:hypothetical protein